MKIKSMLLACVLSVAGSAGLLNSAMAADAATVSATCNDGTAYTGASKKGACSGHKGVKEWAVAAAPAAAATPAAPAPAAAAPAKATTPVAAPAAGGGAGKVWVNTSSKVYHCEGAKYYGTTKEGSYMTEAEAKAAGNRPDHGKACTK
ncbi:hypothetical protein ACO0K0_06615 [Undibacterium sp. SXout11W]|uniref:hypothetical protein n=1 Tax=Undibacterium sp. SXout11W TaxID=3413050 RepID=UPI003BF1D134